MASSGQTGGHAPPPHDHVCLDYAGPAAFEAAAYDFLAAGRAAGEQVWLVAGWSPRDWDFEPVVVPVSDHYPEGAAIEPAAGVAAYARATERAIAEGYTGLRVAADATPLVRTPVQLDAFARYEIQVDRYMRDHPFTAMCGYDRARLPDGTVEQLACLHPVSGAPFRLIAAPPGRGDAALAGEVDETTRPLFLQALRRAELRPAGGELVLDAGELGFIDHNTLLHLDAHARELGATAVLRTRLSAAARLASLLELTALRVEQMA